MVTGISSFLPTVQPISLDIHTQIICFITNSQFHRSVGSIVDRTTFYINIIRQ